MDKQRIRKLFRKIGRDHQRPDRLADRQRMIDHINACKRHGVVAVISGGQDCDGYKWDGNRTLIPATLTHFRAWEDKTLSWADGPRWYSIERPISYRNWYKQD